MIRRIEATQRICYTFVSQERRFINDFCCIAMVYMPSTIPLRERVLPKGHPRAPLNLVGQAITKPENPQKNWMQPSKAFRCVRGSPQPFWRPMRYTCCRTIRFAQCHTFAYSSLRLVSFGQAHKSHAFCCSYCDVLTAQWLEKLL